MNRACFPKEKHQNSQKWAKFMTFSFCPFLWFGLLGRLLILCILDDGCQESVCPTQGPKSPQKIGERGFQSQKTPFLANPEKGAVSQKVSISIQGTTGKIGTRHCRENWDFLTWNTLFWGGRKWVFLTPKPFFLDFGNSWPCKGQMDS